MARTLGDVIQSHHPQAAALWREAGDALVRLHAAGQYLSQGFARNMIVDGAPITDSLRAKNLLINNTISFFTTNVFVYFANILLVFKRGRHHPWMEFFYFTAINGISFVLSQIAGPWLIHKFGVPTNVAIFTNMVFAAVINFIARKFFIFHG